MNRKLLTVWVLFLSLGTIWITDSVMAAEWGSLKGRFVVDGMPPQLPALVVDKDQFCIDSKPINELVVVGDNGGLANAVVYVFLGRRGKIDVHPDYAEQLSDPVMLNNLRCSFHPHIALVRTGQTIDIKNSDPVGHNTKIDGRRNKFNQTIPAGETIEYQAQQTEVTPAPVNCSIHTWMFGHLLVQDHPYMAVSAEDGTFEIKNLPAGDHEFQFWHEAPGNLRDLKLNGGTTDRRGRVELTIPAGETLDLGEIKVPASELR